MHNPLLDPQIARALDTSRLELIILPTEKCNFRCTYCYEDFKIGRMRQEVVIGIKNWISLRCPELKFLYVSWFGGEPLLAFDVILEINEYAKGLSAVFNVWFKSGITTNGSMLDKDRFERLIESGIFDYQITLDGPESIHDKTRKKTNGEGTFDIIYNNLQNMRKSDHDFHVNLRLHLMPSNFEINKAFTFKLAEDFGSDLRFDIFPHTVRNLGGSNVHTRDLFLLNECSTREAEISDLFYVASGRKKLKIDAESEVKICYAAKANSFVVRPDGRIGKCTVDLYSDRNIVGHLKENGRIEINNPRFWKWIRGLMTGNGQALSCPLSTIDLSDTEHLQRLN